MYLIDLDELVKATCGRCKEAKDGKWFTDCLLISCEWSDVMPILQKLPEVKAGHLRRGQWLEDRCDIYCAACGERYNCELPFMHRGEGGIAVGFAFCPHCGAHMEGEIYG